jgi:hypothetical protein
MNTLDKYQVCELNLVEQRNINGGNPIAIGFAIGITLGFFWKALFKKR